MLCRAEVKLAAANTRNCTITAVPVDVDVAVDVTVEVTVDGEEFAP